MYFKIKSNLDRYNVYLTNCYNLSLELRLHLGKDLRVRKRRWQLVSIKNTEVSLHYIYKVSMKKPFSVHKCQSSRQWTLTTFYFYLSLFSFIIFLFFYLYFWELGVRVEMTSLSHQSHGKI